MSEILINDLDLLKFCQRSIHGELPSHITDVFPSERYACFGQNKPNGEAKWAVCIYDIKVDHDCVLDIALNFDGLFSRKLFEAIARVTCSYAFLQCNFLRMTAYVRESNKKSQRIVEGWGGKREGLIELGYGPPKPENMIVYGMTRHNCRWI